MKVDGSGYNTGSLQFSENQIWAYADVDITEDLYVGGKAVLAKKGTTTENPRGLEIKQVSGDHIHIRNIGTTDKQLQLNVGGDIHLETGNFYIEKGTDEFFKVRKDTAEIKFNNQPILYSNKLDNVVYYGDDIQIYSPWTNTKSIRPKAGLNGTALHVTANKHANADYIYIDGRHEIDDTAKFQLEKWTTAMIGKPRKDEL